MSGVSGISSTSSLGRGLSSPTLALGNPLGEGLSRLEPNSASSGGVSHAETVAQIGKEIKGIKESARLDEVRGLCHRIIEFMGRADSDGYQQCIDAMVATPDTRMGVLRHIVMMASTGNESDAFLAQTKQIVCDILSNEQRTEQHNPVMYQFFKIAATHPDVSPAFLSMTQEMVLKMMALPNAVTMQGRLLNHLFTFATNMHEEASTNPARSAFVKTVFKMVLEVCVSKECNWVLKVSTMQLLLAHTAHQGSSHEFCEMTPGLYREIVSHNDISDEHKAAFFRFQVEKALESQDRHYMAISQEILMIAFRKQPNITAVYFMKGPHESRKSPTDEYMAMMEQFIRFVIDGSNSDQVEKTIVLLMLHKMLDNNHVEPSISRMLNRIPLRS